MTNQELNEAVTKNWNNRPLPFNLKYNKKEGVASSVFRSGITVRAGQTIDDIAEELVTQMKNLMNDVGSTTYIDVPSFTAYMTSEAVVFPLMSNELGEVNKYLTAYVLTQVDARTNQAFGSPTAWLIINGNFENQAFKAVYTVKDGVNEVAKSRV